MYDIVEHRHRFAAWAAGRASSVTGHRFPVEFAAGVIDSLGLKRYVTEPNELPSPTDMDEWHLHLRSQAIDAFGATRPAVSHGIVAKLINVYFKAILVCTEHHLHPSVAALHPPVDRIMLSALARRASGSEKHRWREWEKVGWSKFDERTYLEVIAAIRDEVGDQPMWTIERYWSGFQSPTKSRRPTSSVTS